MKNAVIALGGFVLLLVVMAVWSRGRVEQVRQPELSLPVGAGTDGDIARLVDAGQKIAAIKLYRRLHNVGLKDAKDAVDKLAAERAPAKAG